MCLFVFFFNKLETVKKIVVRFSEKINLIQNALDSFYSRLKICYLKECELFKKSPLSGNFWQEK